MEYAKAEEKKKKSQAEILKEFCSEDPISISLCGIYIEEG